jgi:hypothetical protein
VSAFPKAAVAVLEAEREVDIETQSSAGRKHRVTIWIVVVDGVPYVRSVRGPRGLWYRHLVARNEGALVAKGKRIPFRATRVRSRDTIDAVSDAFRKKYPRSGGSLVAMVRDEVLDTTMRLEPV